MLRYVACLSVLIGCAGTNDGADSAGATSCDGGTAPVIVDMYCENTGMLVYAPTGELTPTMTVWADVEDADGDLTEYISELFFDDVLDGEVDTTDSLGRLAGSINDEPCDVPAIILGTTVFLRGGRPLFETTYEWGLVVTDATGQQSALSSVTCKTPDKSGEGATQ